MNIKLEKNNLIKIMTIIVFALSIFFRIQNVFNHFTHYDDIGVAVTLLDKSNLLLPWYNWHRLDFFWNQGWTYAPLQIYIISLILSNKFDYIPNMVLSRIPSFCFGVMALLLIYYFIKKISKLNNEKVGDISSLLAIVLMGFSWENIIYSAQAEPYTIGLVSITLLMLCFLQPIVQLRQYIFLGVLCAFFCYSHFQMFIFVFAFYLVNYVDSIKKHNYKSLCHYIYSSILSLVLTLPLLYRFYNSGLIEKGTSSWNIGLNNQFLFSLPSRTENIFAYIYSFFTNNIFEIFRTFFVSNNSSIFINTITLVLILFAVLGWYYGHFNKNQAIKKIIYFFDLSGGILLVLICMGKLTLSPSRHIMILIPVFITLIVLGAQVVLKKATIKVILALITILALIFLNNYPQEYQNRYSKMRIEKLQTLVAQYDISYICAYNYWFDLELMKFDGFECATDYILDEYQYQLSNKKSCKEKKILVCSTGPTSPDIIKKTILNLNKQLNNTPIRDEIKLDKLELIYSEEVLGATSIEYSRSFGVGNNGKFIYIYKVAEN